MSPNRPVKPARRWQLALAVGLVALCAGFLSWTNIRAGRAADRATTTADKAATAARSSGATTKNLAQILNRRAPTLEYLACHDAAADRLADAQASFSIAQAVYVQALVTGSGKRSPGGPPLDSIVLVRDAGSKLQAAEWVLADAQAIARATTDPTAPTLKDVGPERPHRCPALPLPGAGS